MSFGDEEIKKNIVDQLYWYSRVSAADVKVEVADGKVKLTGTVPTLSARATASDCVWVVPGVRSLKDELEVKFQPEIKVLTDDEIRFNIDQVLLWNSDIVSTDIKPSVKDGRVTLNGTVPSFWEKMRAELIASKMGGVITIKNMLSVVPSKNYKDKRITERIINELKQNSFTNAESIDVKVEGGKVTLSGTVPNRYAYIAAYNAAECTRGVVDVIINITIKR